MCFASSSLDTFSNSLVSVLILDILICFTPFSSLFRFIAVIANDIVSSIDIPDARILVDNARFFSQSNKLTYDESVEIETVAKHLADQSHQFTQYSGVRPFGVALIIAGVDRKGTRIFVTDPSGTYIPYTAVAIGGNSDEVTDFLEKNYKNGMSMDETMSLAIAAINLKSDEKDVKHIRMSKIRTDTKLFEKVSNEELAKYAQAEGALPNKST